MILIGIDMNNISLAYSIIIIIACISYNTAITIYLNTGKFGKVYRGQLRKQNSVIEIAVKTIKSLLNI